MNRLDRHIETVRARVGMEKMLNAASWALSGVAAVMLILVVVERLAHFRAPEPFWIAGSLAGAGVIVAIVLGLVRRPRPIEAAAVIDQRLGLKERFSTAVFVRQSMDQADPFAAAALADAAKLAETVDLKSHFPVKLPRSIWIAVSLAAVAFGVAKFVGDVSFGNDATPSQFDPAVVQRAEQAKQNLQNVIASIDSAPTDIARSNEIQLARTQLEQMLAAPINDADRANRAAAKAAQRLEDAIKQKIQSSREFAQAQEDARAFNDLGQTTEEGRVPEAQRALGAGNVDKAVEELQKLTQEFDKMDAAEQQKAADQMEKLARQLEKIANDPQKMNQLAQRMQQMGVNQQQAQQIQQLAQQAARGDPQAQQQLQQIQQQMQNQLQQQNPAAAQQMQQLMQQMQGVAGSQAMARQMQQAAAQMAQAMQQASQNPGQGQSQQQGQQAQGQQGGGGQQGMQQGLQGMKDALDQMQAIQQDMRQMQAARQAAQQAGQQAAQAIGGGQQGPNPGPGQGQGQGNGGWQGGEPQGPGGAMGGPGQGAGGQALIEAAPMGFKDEFSASQTDEKGRILASTFVKAGMLKGESKLALQEVVRSSLQQTTDVVDQQKVSRKAQQAVRDYFSSMTAGTSAAPDPAPATP